MSPNIERPAALNSTLLNTDSHRATMVGFCTEDGLYSNLVLEEGADTPNIYTLEYPMKLNYPGSIIVKAQGVFEVRGAEPWLTDATVWYADKPHRSGGSFYITIMEGVFVRNNTTGKEQVVALPVLDAVPINGMIILQTLSGRW